MHKGSYTSEGFILASRNYSETDRILMVLTKDRGFYPILAKGARKVSSRKRGHLVEFNKIRFSAVDSSGFDIMSEAETIISHSNFKKDLKKVSVAYFFSETIGKLVGEKQDTNKLFNLLEKYFLELNNSQNLKKIRLDFIRDILVDLGFWPNDKKMVNHDKILEGVAEKKFSSVRVAKKVLY